MTIEEAKSIEAERFKTCVRKCAFFDLPLNLAFFRCVFTDKELIALGHAALREMQDKQELELNTDPTMLDGSQFLLPDNADTDFPLDERPRQNPEAEFFNPHAAIDLYHDTTRKKDNES